MNIFSRLLGRGPKPPPSATATPIDTRSANAAVVNATPIAAYVTPPNANATPIANDTASANFIPSATLIDNTPIANATPEMLRTALINGDLSTIQRIIINKQYDINITLDNEGQTPLIFASKYGNVPIVNFLLENRAKIDQGDKDGKTPLMFASMNGHAPVVELLIQKHADVNKGNNKQETPLFWASRNGHAPVVELLIQKHADVNKANQSGYTPMYWASRNGHDPVVELLLQNGVLVDQKTFSNTPLHEASRYGNVSTVKILLKKRANVKMEGRDGKTPLSMAVEEEAIAVEPKKSKYAEIVKILRNNATSINGGRKRKTTKRKKSNKRRKTNKRKCKKV
jgi:ankyrin repeat protein